MGIISIEAAFYAETIEICYQLSKITVLLVRFYKCLQALISLERSQRVLFQRDQGLKAENKRLQDVCMRSEAAYHFCDFTQFFAAPALIKLPQRFSFEHEVENEKEEILRSLPHKIAMSSKKKHKPAASCRWL
ncbi:MAG TPA: hypothetical protein VF043_03410 [Ktedonobacteraceae bacterium]